VAEQCLRYGRRGEQVRPFCQRAQVKHHGYSKLLQRVLTDFGAEESFAHAAERVQEHYRIKVPITAVRRQTLKHAAAMVGRRHQPPKIPVKTLVTSLDGSMIPMVRTQAGSTGDGRKNKELYWREARLCCARAADIVDSLYGAVLGNATLSGIVWEQTARAAGLGQETYVHGVGDGALHIIDNFAGRFGTQGRYLLDLFHVSEYLAAAAPAFYPEEPMQWLSQQKEHLLEDRSAQVLSALQSRLEPEEQEEAPVRAAWRYLESRKNHLHYAQAKAAELPLGSGEVESGHRHVIQHRLKLAGSWWSEINAQLMLSLRVVRANKDWNNYWHHSLNN
jgi:hypothetical protein